MEIIIWTDWNNTGEVKGKNNGECVANGLIFRLLIKKQ